MGHVYYSKPYRNTTMHRYAAIQYRHTARQIFQLSLCRNSISPYRKANLPIIAIPQYNIAITQGYYRHTARQDFQLSQCRNTIKKRIYINNEGSQLSAVNIPISIAIPQYGYFETNPCK